MEKGSLIDQRFECLDPVERPEPGMSFAAIDHTGGEEVVVRLLPAASDSDQSVFFRSIEKLVRMSGNHIEKVLDAGLTPYPDLSAGAAGGPDGSAGPGLFVVTARTSGVPLRKLFAEGPEPDVRKVVDIARQVARALAEAARAGCSHGRLSDSTVLVRSGDGASSECRVSVIGFAPWDFGPNALRYEPETVAPEVVLGAVSDIKSDCYALGALLYRMLTGAWPFVAASRESMALSHLNDKVAAPSTVRPDRAIPIALDNLVLRLMEKNPERRLAQPDQIVVHLESIFASGAPVDDEGSDVIVARPFIGEEESELDEGISFASGERISTTDFPAVTVSEVLSAVTPSRATPSISEPETVPQEPCSEVPPVPAPTISAAMKQGAKDKRRNTGMVVFAAVGIVVVGLAAAAGWYISSGGTQIKDNVPSGRDSATRSDPASTDQPTPEPAPSMVPAGTTKQPPVPAPAAVSTPPPPPQPAPGGIATPQPEPVPVPVVTERARTDKVDGSAAEAARRENKIGVNANDAGRSTRSTSKSDRAATPRSTDSRPAERPEPDKAVKERPAANRTEQEKAAGNVPSRGRSKTGPDWNSGLDDEDTRSTTAGKSGSGQSGRQQQKKEENKKPSLNWDE